MKNKPAALKVWSREYNIWFYALFGTAVGAGTLFLPLQIGLSGAPAMIMMCLTAIPFTYYPHLALARYIISSDAPAPTLLSATAQYYGNRVANIINFLYTLTFLLIICIYSASITNSVSNFLVKFYDINVSRPLLAFLVVSVLHIIFLSGKKITLKIMGILVIPLAIYLIVLSLTLIHYRDPSAIAEFTRTPEFDISLLKNLWLLLPVMVFSFSHTPIISTFAAHCRKTYGDAAEEHMKKIMKPSYFLICAVILFFVFSCVSALSRPELLAARADNVTVLTAIGDKNNLLWIILTATPVAVVAMSKSFLGTYFGTAEGVRGIVEAAEQNRRGTKTRRTGGKIKSIFIIFIISLVFSVCNPNILSVISVITGPLIALILFILPSASVYIVKPLSGYKSPANLMVLLTGIAAFGITLFSVIL
ncbi:TPA: transporter [Morganella morganii]|nr:transporter [Morganella morganii]